MINTQKILEEFDERFNYSLIESVIKTDMTDEETWFVIRRNIKDFLIESIQQAIAEERERVREEIEATPATLNVENNNSQQIYENWGRQAMKKQILSTLDKPLQVKK